MSKSIAGHSHGGEVTKRLGQRHEFALFVSLQLAGRKWSFCRWPPARLPSRGSGYPSWPHAFSNLRRLLRWFDRLWIDCPAPIKHPIISALWLKFSVRFRVDHGEESVCSPVRIESRICESV